MYLLWNGQYQIKKAAFEIQFKIFIFVSNIRIVTPVILYNDVTTLQRIIQSAVFA